jgi:hypothetical protein
MKAMFNEKGKLVINRAGRWVNQLCFLSDESCGEWCPQVSEPIRQKNRNMNRTDTVIHICQGRHWKFTEFEDRRQP